MIFYRRFVPRVALLALLVSNASASRSDPIAISSSSVRAGGRSFGVRVVKVPLGAVRVRAGLGQGLVGRTESLAGIARRYGAAAAINGGYFAAYTSNPRKNPTHTIVTHGQVVHLGNIGSVLCFTRDGGAFIARVPLKISGTLDGNQSTWYAFWLNRNPEKSSSTITIFTPHWGTSTGLNDGIQVVVSGGKVLRVGNGSQAIPRNGYAIYFRNQAAMAARFHAGQSCAYRVIPGGNIDQSTWSSVVEAIGCGPRLLTNGRITVDARGEGFSDPKVLSESTARSMVGLSRDGQLILATSSGTMRQMAEVMQKLGAWQAMNLDGGASSGLWVGGRYLTSPGRLLNNALLLLEKR